MNATIAILSGGKSHRLQPVTPDKGLLRISNKPMILWMIETVKELSKNILVIISSENQEDEYRNVIGDLADIVVDNSASIKSPLLGAHAAFTHARDEYTLLLPNDTPLLNRDALRLLMELCNGHDVVIPRWPNGFIEPLHAVYRTKIARKKSEELISLGKLKMELLLQNMKVLYVNTIVLKQFDPQLNMFLNINAPEDLKKLKRLYKEII